MIIRRRAAAAPAPPTPPPAVTVRPAEPADRAAIARVAARDSKAPPAGPCLVAERDGRLLAVLSTADGSYAADPFEPTVELIELLRVRAGSSAPRRQAHRRRTVATAGCAPLPGGAT